MAVVEVDGIVGTPQGTFGTGLVDVVATDNVGEDILIVDGIAFGGHFQETTLSPSPC